MSVNAPYHFVPFSKWTCLPDWSAQISQDQPFADGISGQINLQIKNFSPLLIGGERQKGSQKTAEIVHFIKDPDGKETIPGASIRGMIRNVMEIATFSDVTFMDDTRFGVRDISRKESGYLKYYNDHKEDICAGWLKFDGNWKFTKTFANEVSYEYLEQVKSAHATNFSCNNANPIEKYNQFKIHNRWKFSASDEPFSKVEEFNQGNQIGHLVFVGAMPGKRGDYIFSPPKKPNSTSYEISPHVFRDFLISHKEYGGKYQVTKNEKQTLFEYLFKHQHAEYGIPIFALKEKNKIKVLGLAKMMKIAAPEGIHSLYQRNNKQLLGKNITEKLARRVDMTQGVFGTTRNEAGYSLKSRISFSDATRDVKSKIKSYDKIILGQPKASYYPAYLEQEVDDGEKCRKYSDYFSKNARLAGWKRYPIRNKHSYKAMKLESDNANVIVTLKPLEPDTIFKTKLRFHNLKRVELGALLWSLDFGAKKDTYHKLGMGKPLGFGDVQLKVMDKDMIFKTFSGESWTAAELVIKFEEYMDKQYQNAIKDPSPWLDSPQMQNLLAMASPSQEVQKLRYMLIDEYNKSTNNENKKALTYYQGINRREPNLKKLERTKNYLYPGSNGYGKEIQEILEKEIQEQKELEEKKLIAKRQEEDFEKKINNASTLTKEVLEIIAKHMNNKSTGLDGICKRIISKKDKAAIQEFLDYTQQKTGADWLNHSNQKTRNKRNNMIARMEKIIE